MDCSLVSSAAGSSESCAKFAFAAGADRLFTTLQVRTLESFAQRVN